NLHDSTFYRIQRPDASAGPILARAMVGRTDCFVAVRPTTYHLLMGPRLAKTGSYVIRRNRHLACSTLYCGVSPLLKYKEIPQNSYSI
ncbi:MAG: hypothetical protein WD038_05435, partial [Balneolales bacterium]